MEDRTKGIIVAVIASSCWGFMGIFTRGLSGYGLSVYDMSMIRSLIAALSIGLVLFFIDRESLKIKRHDIPLLVGLGLTKLISDACIFNAELNIPLALAGVLQLTYPYFVIIFAVLLLNEKLTKTKILAAVLGFTGCVFVTDFSLGGEIRTIGIILAIISAIVTSLNIIGNKVMLERKYSPISLVFYTFLICGICNIPMSNVGNIANAATDVTALLLMLGIGLLMTAIPHSIDNWAMKRVEASIIAIIGILEAIVAAIVGVVFFSETPSVLMVIGILMAVTAIVIVNRKPKND